MWPARVFRSLVLSTSLVAPTRSLICGGARPALSPPTLMRAHGLTASAGRRAARKARGLARQPPTGAADAAWPKPGANESAAAVAELPVPTDAQQFAERASLLARLRQPRKALELYDAARGVELGREVLPSVTRALLKMRRLDLALELHRRHASEQPGPADTSSTTALFLALCRASRLEDATALLAELERAHPPPVDAPAADETARWRGGAAVHSRDPDEPVWHAIGSAMLPGLALARLEADEVEGALELASRLAASPSTLPQAHTLTRLIRAFGKKRSPRGVYACLDALALAPEDPDAECLQAVTDALVRSVEFVKGGVSMATLPESEMPEVAFVGRSNVGKSSLVNMVLGRKGLAYMSKKPGKTQQYNYFILNEHEEHQHEDDGGPFHLVDMPGLGYAKVPGAERRKWLEFLQAYAASRRQLKLLLHLVDSKVGPIETDERIMRMVRAAQEAAGEAGRPCEWQYAVVLTKADKEGAQAIERATAAVLKAVEAEGCPPPAAIVATSAKAKFGRDAMWRLLRRAALSPAA